MRIDSRTAFQSGYVPPATPRSKSAKVDIIENAKPNLLAKFLVTRELAPSDPRYKQINVWPKDIPGFRETVMEYHAAIENLARSFLPIWATSLSMPVDFFEPFFKDPHLTLSLLNYPPQKIVGNRQYGIAPHTDNSFMTFLAQSNVSGLAVRMPSGHWRLVENIPGTFLVNTGNVIMRWTNDRYLSTKHRVINTAEVDRYSISMFFGPSGDASSNAFRRANRRRRRLDMSRSPIRDCESGITGCGTDFRRQARILKIWSEIDGSESYFCVMRLSLLAGSLGFLLTGVRAQSVADFYKGRNIDLYVGYSVGGAYDLYARILARHMSKHIPGNPNVLPKNMEGAGSLRLANWLYNVAPRDGTVIGSVVQSTPLDQIFQVPGVSYDAAKFNWIGNPIVDNLVSITSRQSGLGSLDIVRSKGGLICGSSGAGPTVTFANAIGSFCRADARVVAGYPGVAAVTLAMQRNEVNCNAGQAWSSMKATMAQLMREGQLNVIVQWEIVGSGYFVGCWTRRAADLGLCAV